MKDPAELVLEFIADYFRWNEDACQRDERAGPADAARIASMDVAAREYNVLRDRYCRPGFAGEPISYGSPALHVPELEHILDVIPVDDGWTVRTRLTDDADGSGLTQDFDYHLSCSDGRLYLDSVQCIIDGEGFESL